MVNNLINIDDFADLYRKVKSNPRLSKKIFKKIFSTANEKVESTWAHTETVPDKWWFIPEVEQRWNYLITGDKEIYYTKYFVDKYLSNKNDCKAFSFACGAGTREIAWAKTNHFSLIKGFDLSKKRIEKAKDEAEDNDLDYILSFSVGNASQLQLEENYFDVYFGEQAVHHFSQLENILLRIKKFVKPNGYLLINEFVGPERFQWTDEQIKYSNELLISIPDSYKKYWGSNQIKKKVYKPGKVRMLLNDPSEAIESSKILPLLDAHFEKIELKNYGGTILHLVFDGIAHNFINNSEETKFILNKCFAFEDELINAGKISSDFVFAVYKNNK